MKSIWPNETQAAISLTYDDALPVHIDQVTHKHESNGSRATFYTNIGDSFMQQHEEWKAVASRGHELGNHSIFHPCRKSDSMLWLDDGFDLKHYSAKRFRQELEVANFILGLTDGKQRRSYGNTCCHTTIGSGENETSMQPILKELFGAARGALTSEIISPLDYNIYELGHFSGDKKSFEDIKDVMQLAIEQKGWVIFMFHGVGEETHSLYIDKAEHDKLLDWIGDNQELIWSRPVIEVADYLQRL